MLAIFAILSDIPAFLLTFIGDLTGQDMSGAIDAFNRSFARILEKAGNIIDK